MDAKRLALVVATSEYSSPDFAPLPGVEQDVLGLCEVLQDPSLGDYEVRVIRNPRYHEMSEEVGRFLASCGPKDSILVYLSGHGIRLQDGQLQFVASNTDEKLLYETSFSASTLSRQLKYTKAPRALLVLDCCFAGAFPAGTVIKSSTTVDLSSLEASGRVVVAASTAYDYAFQTTPDVGVPRSVFTSAMILGLSTGDADLDQDGVVTPHELFSYLTDSMKVTAPAQTPVFLSDGIQGAWPVAYNPTHSELRIDTSSSAPRVRPDRRIITPKPVGMADALEDLLDQIENASRGNVGEDLVSTGLESLDGIIGGGLKRGELVLYTGPPGVGASTLALNAVRATSIRNGEASLFLSGSFGRTEVMMRILCAEALVPLHSFRAGRLSDEDWSRVARTTAEISSAPVFIQDELYVSVEQEAARIPSDLRLALIVIDPLELGNEAALPVNFLAALRHLKLLAMKLGATVLVCLPDQPNLRSGHRALGLLDRYADTVISVHREDLLVGGDKMRGGEADLTVLRSKRFASGRTTVAFQGHFARFVDMQL